VDSSFVAPNLTDFLISPIVDISGAERCTCFFSLHTCVPTLDEGDYWTVEYSLDEGETWIREGCYAGDTPPPACDVFVATGLDGVSIDEHLPASSLRLRFAMHTDDTGCGPGASGAAGIFLDDVYVVVSPQPSAVRRTSWSRIKALWGR